VLEGVMGGRGRGCHERLDLIVGYGFKFMGKLYGLWLWINIERGLSGSAVRVGYAVR